MIHYLLAIIYRPKEMYRPITITLKMIIYTIVHPYFERINNYFEKKTVKNMSYFQLDIYNRFSSYIKYFKSAWQQRLHGQNYASSDQKKPSLKLFQAE